MPAAASTAESRHRFMFSVVQLDVSEVAVVLQHAQNRTGSHLGACMSQAAWQYIEYDEPAPALARAVHPSEPPTPQSAPATLSAHTKRSFTSHFRNVYKTGFKSSCGKASTCRKCQDAPAQVPAPVVHPSEPPIQQSAPDARHHCRCYPHNCSIYSASVD
jgi:hypothetical protein